MNPFRLNPVPQEVQVPHEAWRIIPGWFDFQSLYSQIVKDSRSGDVLVEIGVFEGKSAIFMASEIKKSGKLLNFYAIDPWIMMRDEKGDIYGCSFLDFQHNAELCDVGDYVTPIKDFSVEAAKVFANETVRFVFIDGEHSYEAVKADIEAWLPKIVPGGIIAGHDYNNCWPGVKKAVDEFFPNRTIDGESWIWQVQ